jgi:hypothetical protein
VGGGRSWRGLSDSEIDIKESEKRHMKN